MKSHIMHFEERYFCGIEHKDGLSKKTDAKADVSRLWVDFFMNHLPKIQNIKTPTQMLGISRFQGHSDTMDYFILVETNSLNEDKDGQISKTIEKGEYICFTSSFDEFFSELSKAQEFLRSEHIDVRDDYCLELYRQDQNYGTPGAIFDLCFKLERE